MSHKKPAAGAFGVECKANHGDDWQWLYRGSQGSIQCVIPNDPKHYRCCADAWPTGKEASNAIREARQIGYVDARVRPIPDDATMNGGELIAVYFASQSIWTEREQARFDSGEYKPLPFEPNRFNFFWQQHGLMRHYAHLASDGKRVSYTADETKGREDRQTVTSIGKYLNQHRHAFQLDRGDLDQMVEIFRDACGLGGYVLKFARTPDEIECDAYCSGEIHQEAKQYSPTSCMSHQASVYDTGGLHPVRAYGAGDLAVAYCVDPDDDGRVTARAVCWPDKLCYSTIYGDAIALGRLLRDAGYRETDNFNGARLLKIKCRGSDEKYLMPYLDGGGSVDSLDDQYWVIADDGDYQCDGTGGSLYMRDNRISCDGCGTRLGEDDCYGTENGTYCERCYGDMQWQCDDCGADCGGDDQQRAVEGVGHVCPDCVPNYVPAYNRGMMLFQHEDVFRCTVTARLYTRMRLAGWYRNEMVSQDGFQLLNHRAACGDLHDGSLVDLNAFETTHERLSRWELQDQFLGLNSYGPPVIDEDGEAYYTGPEPRPVCLNAPNPYQHGMRLPVDDAPSVPLHWMHGHSPAMTAGELARLQREQYLHYWNGVQQVVREPIPETQTTLTAETFRAAMDAMLTMPDPMPGRIAEAFDWHQVNRAYNFNPRRGR